jgi:hypothetical protein
MLVRALWLTPPIAAILALQPTPQLKTIVTKDQQVRFVACLAEPGIFPMHRVLASDRNLERYDREPPKCVELTPALPWRWGFGAEVSLALESTDAGDK